MRPFALAALASALIVSGGAGERSAVTHVVEMRGVRFVPETVVAQPGDTIRWVNRDVVPHTATASDSTWDSGRMEAGATWTLVVSSDSFGPYVCVYHPTMTGRISEK